MNVRVTLKQDVYIDFNDQKEIAARMLLMQWFGIYDSCMPTKIRTNNAGMFVYTIENKMHPDEVYEIGSSDDVLLNERVRLFNDLLVSDQSTKAEKPKVISS